MGSESDSSRDIKRILWAPWRMEYIQNCDTPEGCVFCEIPKQNKDRENLMIYRGRSAFVIMNKFPYNNGHLMVVPYRHTCQLASFNSEEKTECFDLIVKMQAILDEVMHPHGYNIGMNLGRIAGAGIADHLHYHIVPRWSGDTNFMPILGQAKVVSEGLDKTWFKITEAIKQKMQQED